MERPFGAIAPVEKPMHLSVTGTALMVLRHRARRRQVRRLRRPAARLRDLTATPRSSVGHRCLRRRSLSEAQSCRRCDLPGFGFVGRREEFRHRFDLHVAMLELPLVVLLEPHRADQPDDRGFVREDAYHVGPTLDLFVEPLEWIGPVQFAAVLLGEIQIGQHVRLAVIDERRELRPFRPQLIGDMRSVWLAGPVRL